MTESQFQSKLLKKLRERLPQAVIFKHSDRFNSGVPDFSVTLAGNTHWFELKIFPNRLTKIQDHFIRSLGKRAHEVMNYPGSQMTRIDSLYCNGMKSLVEGFVKVCGE